MLVAGAVFDVCFLQHFNKMIFHLTVSSEEPTLFSLAAADKTEIAGSHQIRGRVDISTDRAGMHCFQPAWLRTERHTWTVAMCA